MLRQALLGGFCLPIAPVFANPLRDSCQRRHCLALAPDQRPIGGRSYSDRWKIKSSACTRPPLPFSFRTLSSSPGAV